MDFVDRIEEMQRLDRLMARGEGGLAVVYGRRRIGKTRLLLDVHVATAVELIPRP